MGDLDPDRHRRLATEDTRLGVIPTLSSDEDVDDCGRLASEGDAGREERERGVVLMATATGAVTASPPVTAASGCESDDCAKVAGDESQLSVSPVGEIAITADNLITIGKSEIMYFEPSHSQWLPQL